MPDNKKKTKNTIKTIKIIKTYQKTCPNAWINGETDHVLVEKKLSNLYKLKCKFSAKPHCRPNRIFYGTWQADSNIIQRRKCSKRT